MKNEITNKAIDTIEDLYDKHTWAKVTVYAVGSILAFYILGKASHFIADAIRGFKNLRNAIKE